MASCEAAADESEVDESEELEDLEEERFLLIEGEFCLLLAVWRGSASRCLTVSLMFFGNI